MNNYFKKFGLIKNKVLLFFAGIIAAIAIFTIATSGDSVDFDELVDTPVVTESVTE